MARTFWTRSALVDALERLYVLELPFYGVVVLGVAAAAATAPIDGADAEALLECRQDRGPAAVVGRRSVDQHEGGPCALRQ